MLSGPQSDRAFGFMLAAVFAAIAGVAVVVSGRVSVPLVATAAGFALLALVSPRILLPLNRLWQKLVHGLGFVMNHLVLGTLLYLVITPVGLVMRIFGRNPMSLDRDPDRESYFTPVKRTVSEATLPDLF